MEQQKNPQVEREILDALSKKYVTSRTRDTIHVSHLIYCLTKGYHELTNPLPPNDQELMLFSLGYGLENVLLREESHSESGKMDGIEYSPDFVPLSGGKAELKTTRMATGKEFPETWIEQISAYCYCEKLLVYDLAVLHIVGNYKPPFPCIAGYRLTFEQTELDANWANLLKRKMVLDVALETKTPPPAKLWCKVDNKGVSWECIHCRYKIRCGIMQ